MIVEFNMQGPFEVPFLKKDGGQFINGDCADAFLKKHSALMARKGVYIFCLKIASGVIPAYVGKATKSFKQEAFTNDKLLKYNDALTDYKNDWKPLMYLAVHPTSKLNGKAVNQLETYLIQVAALRNPDLKNIQKTKIKLKWSIKGVYNSGGGQPPKPAKEFKKVMGL